MTAHVQGKALEPHKGPRGAKLLTVPEEPEGETLRVTDPDECGGNSDSFIEGCQAYAKEQNGDEENEDEGSENEDE